MEKTVTLLPNASSLIESIRSIGYSFEAALADIIDNSISAHASDIQIYLGNKNEAPFIQIIDDGDGMTKNELLEALRLGSKNPTDKRESDDLGRFGLGLKSASFSQCKILTVISKKENEVNAYRWDLDWISVNNKFEVIELEENETVNFENLDKLNLMPSGTIIQWENFDRINISSSSVQDELVQLMDFAIEHLSLIYHRFITEGLTLSVNNTMIEAKDPFLLNHPSTQIRPEKEIKIENQVIHMKPFVIPYFSKLSSKDQRMLGKTSEDFKDQQGFYLYRNKRLIVWGDYLGLSRKTELGKNLRIQVDIPNNLDYMWEIDVKKSRARVPSKIRKNLLSAITDGENISKKIYNFRGNKEIQNEQSMWQFIEERNGNFRFEVNKDNHLFMETTNTLNESQKELFDIYITNLTYNLPIKKIYSQLADGHSKVLTDNENTIKELNKMLNFISLQNNINKKQFCKALMFQEPYRSNIKAVEILKKIIGDAIDE